MAYDLFLRKQIDTDYSRAAPAPAPLPLAFTAVERKTLIQLEKSTAAFATALVGWARQQGIAARITSTAIYTQEDTDKHYEEGRSGIKAGRLDWHQVGRAFHLAIPKLANGQDNLDAYARIGAYARSQGGEWLGDKPIRTTKGIIFDTAHFEYHPGVTIAAYRKLPVSVAEFKSAQKRRQRFG